MVSPQALCTLLSASTMNPWILRKRIFFFWGVKKSQKWVLIEWGLEGRSEVVWHCVAGYGVALGQSPCSSYRDVGRLGSEGQSPSGGVLALQEAQLCGLHSPPRELLLPSHMSELSLSPGGACTHQGFVPVFCCCGLFVYLGSYHHRSHFWLGVR